MGDGRVPTMPHNAADLRIHLFNEAGFLGRILPELKLSGSKAARCRLERGLCQHSNRSLFVSNNSARKRFGEARDWAGIFSDTGRSRATETALSCARGGKAAES
jgi:hypothetical protein